MLLSWGLIMGIITIQATEAIIVGAIAAPVIWYEAKKRARRATMTRDRV